MDPWNPCDGCRAPRNGSDGGCYCVLEQMADLVGRHEHYIEGIDALLAEAREENERLRAESARWEQRANDAEQWIEINRSDLAALRSHVDDAGVGRGNPRNDCGPQGFEERDCQDRGGRNCGFRVSIAPDPHRNRL